MFRTHVTGSQDLLSVDIQRGRDVGVPPYITIRRLCGFKEVTSFKDLSTIFSYDVSRLFLYLKNDVVINNNLIILIFGRFKTMKIKNVIIVL